MTVGERIRQERINRGWSQEHMAELCGYKGKASISKIETAGNELSSKKIRLMAEVLGVSIPYLMGWTAQPDVQFLPKEDEDLILAYRQASESRQEAVRALLEIT